MDNALGASDPLTQLLPVLRAQQTAARANPIPSAQERIDWIDRAVDLLRTHEHAFVESLSEDFSWRSADASRLTDIAASIQPLLHARAHVRKWMKPETRKPDSRLALFGARAQIRYQPKGCVGIIAPWNFPVNLTFHPLSAAFAAGNRVMVKPSEYTPATSALLASTIARYYAADECTVVQGGADVGEAFARLPFDHLFFTGSTRVGRQVMKSAAENLTPVTLELGGKSPVIIGRDADMKTCMARILTGKTLNAGQICLAPDYVFVPKERLAELVFAFQAQGAIMFPTLAQNPDYSAIISPRHYERQLRLIEDARAKGASVYTVNPAREDLSAQPYRKVAPTLIVGANADMVCMQEEIFGPVLPVLTYERIEEVLEIINDGERPLGLYYFGHDKDEQELVLNRTISGGVTINDVIFHFAQENLPFGGTGPSGMGRYHGREGFLEFSHGRSVFYQIKPDLLKILRPPYGNAMRQMVQGQIGKARK